MASFNTSDIQITFKLLLLMMSVPVTQFTVEEAHKELNTLVDRIAAIYEQLDNGEFGAVGTWHLMPNQPNWQVSLLV